MVSTLCISCGHEIPAAAQFCGQCGAARPAEVDPEATSVLSAPTPPPPARTTTAARTTPAARPTPSFDWRAWLFGSLQPATILVFSAAACAIGLRGFVLAYSTPDYPGDSPRAVLAILFALALIAAGLGTWAASHLARNGREDRTAARLVFGVGVFACVLNGLAFLQALGS